MIDRVLANFNNKFLNRKFISLILLSLFFVSTPLYAKGIPLTFSYGSEKMAKLHELPGSNYDFGVIYKQVTLFKIPIWNYDKKFCGYIDEKNYAPLTEEEANAIISKANIKLPAFMGIPYWDLFGGKAIILVILAIVGYYYLRRS